MMKKFYIAVIVLAIVAFAALFFFKKEPPVKPEINGILLDEPKPLVTFALEDMNGKPFTDQSFLNQWSLVFFGFTTCPDICPMTMSTINEAMKIIYAEPGVPMPKVIFVSVDPERDTPERLKQYVEHFNKDFLGVTGNHTQLTEFSRQLGVVYEKVYTEDENYLIDHSGSIALINRRGAIVAYFTPPLNAMNLARDYTTVVTVASPCTIPQ
ncbi:MAG: SCO family protein [Gammaproteobacteria bacterium]|jgi:protein SCO1/2